MLKVRAGMAGTRVGWVLLMSGGVHRHAGVCSHAQWQGLGVAQKGTVGAEVHSCGRSNRVHKTGGR